MTATNLQIVAGQTTSGTAAENKYQSPSAGNGTRVTAGSVYNTSGSTDVYTLYIVSDTGAPIAAETIVSRSLRSGESDVPLEILNQMIPPGGTLQVKTNTSGSCCFNFSGIEFTS